MQLYKDNLGKVSITVEQGYWDINKDYDKLVVVEKEGTFGTYISRKPVPAGTVLTDRTYWIPFSSLKEEIVLDYNKWFNEYGGLIGSQAEVLNNLQLVINDIFKHLPQGITFEGSISAIRPNTTKEITLKGATTNDEFAKFTLYRNNTKITEFEEKEFTYIENVSEDTEYKLVAEQNGYKFIASWNVGLAYPFYGGGGSAHTDVINEAHIIKIDHNLAGIYDIVVDHDGDYMFFVAPKDMVIKSIRMNGLEVPVNKIEDIHLDVDYVVYQSDYTYQAGHYPIQINDYTGMDSEDFLGILNSLEDTASAVDVANLKEKIDGLPLDLLYNKEYEPANHSGMGRVYLKKNIKNGKNILEQDMMLKANTIYIIQYDFDLNGEEITIPENCVLKFEGGSLENGILSNAIIDNSNNNHIFKNIILTSLNSVSDITPEWFGCAGDGKIDDTNNMRYALYYSSKLNFELYLNPKLSYYITDTLNYYNNKYYDIYLRLKGTYNGSTNVPDISVSGTNHSIELKLQTIVFKNAIIKGYIKNCSITSYDWNNEGTTLFDTCTLICLKLKNNYLGRFTNFLYNSGIWTITEIDNNRIITYNFAKVDNTEDDNIACVDSYIKNNYISGNTVAAENTENYDGVCFEWYIYNAATISNNFIDFFRIIYAPIKNVIAPPISTENQYQVFRYFYTLNNCYEDSNCTILSKYKDMRMFSINDTFNWLDPSSLKWLTKVKPLYINKQVSTKDFTTTKINTELPPYIMITSRCRQVIEYAKIEQNIDKFFVYYSSPDNIEEHNVFSFEYQYKYLKKPTAFIFYFTDDYNCYYNSYNNDMTPYPIVDNLYNEVTELPELPNIFLSWYKYPLGYRVLYNNKLYELSVEIYPDNKRYYIWKPVTSKNIIDNTTIGSTKVKDNSIQYWNGSNWTNEDGTLTSKVTII